MRNIQAHTGATQRTSELLNVFSRFVQQLTLFNERFPDFFQIVRIALRCNRAQCIGDALVLDAGQFFVRSHTISFKVRTSA